MEMGSKKGVHNIEPGGEMYRCPSCGYENGFHVSFKWNQKGSEAEVYLICPSWHSRFRLGWKVSSAQIKIKKR